MRVAAHGPVVEWPDREQERSGDHRGETRAKSDRAALRRLAGDDPIYGDEGGEHCGEHPDFDADGHGET